MKFSIFQESRLGARKINQDRVGYCYSRDALLMVVADGMGGHLNGELASQIAVQYLTELFRREARTRLGDPARFLHHGLNDAHEAILDCVRTRNLPEAPRTTCVACVVQDGIATWAHAGDSRLYHVRDGKILLQTRDHSKVQWLVDTGQLREEAASRHPERNKVLNCLGGSRPPQVDLSHSNWLADGDALVLCTDGLWGALTPGMIASVLSKKTLRKRLPALLDLAQARAGRGCDNLSVIAMGWTEQGATLVDTSTRTLELDEFAHETSAAARMRPNDRDESRNGGGPADVAAGLINREGTGASQGYLSDEEIERAIEEIRSAIRRRAPPGAR